MYTFLVYYHVTNTYFGWQIGVLGSINIIIMANPAFLTRKHRLFRTLVFTATAASGFAPLIHGCVTFGVWLMMKQSGMPFYLSQFFFLASAGLVYAVSLQISHMMGTDSNHYDSTDQVSREGMAG